MNNPYDLLPAPVDQYGVPQVSGYNYGDPYVGAVRSPGMRGGDLGALQQRVVAARRRQAAAQLAAHQQAQLQQAQQFARIAEGGLQPPGLREEFLGFGTATMGATDTTVQLTGTPQKTVRPRSLVIDSAEGTATASADAIETVTRIDFGTDNQLVSNGALPLGMFTADSNGFKLAGAVLETSVDAVISIARTAAPGAGASRLFSGGSQCTTVGG